MIHKLREENEARRKNLEKGISSAKKLVHSNNTGSRLELEA